jgi:hypothetical protein
MSFKQFSVAASAITAAISPTHIGFLIGGCLNIYIADPWDTPICDFGPWDESTPSSTPFTAPTQLRLPAVAADAEARRQRTFDEFNAAIDAATNPQLALPPARIARISGLLVLNLLLALPVQFHVLPDGDGIQPVNNCDLRREWAESLVKKVRATIPTITTPTVDDVTTVIATARDNHKQARRVLNRARFSLVSVTHLLARRNGTPRRGGKGFIAKTYIARTVRAKQMNSRKINQMIARANRKRRQKYSGSKLSRPLTTKQRAAARKQRKIKTVWKADRLGYFEWLRIYAHRGGQVTKVTTYKVVTPPVKRTTVTTVTTQRPVTRTMKSDALRQGNSRFQLANGVETPMAKTGKFRRTRRTEDELPLSVHYRRMMADGSYNRRKDGQSALNHLYGGVKRDQQKDWKPCWTYEPLFEEGPVGEEDQFDEWDDPLEPWQEDYHQHQLAVEAYQRAAEVMDELFAWQLVDVQDMVAETVVNTVRCEYGAVGDLQMQLVPIVDVLPLPDETASMLALIKAQYGIRLTHKEWKDRQLTKERAKELGSRSPKLSKVLINAGVPADKVSKLLSVDTNGKSKVWETEEYALYDQGNSIYYKSCQRTEEFDPKGYDLDLIEIDGDKKFYGASLFLWTVGEPWSIDGKGYQARAKLRLMYADADYTEVSGLFVDRVYGSVELLNSKLHELADWWHRTCLARGYKHGLPILSGEYGLVGVNADGLAENPLSGEKRTDGHYLMYCPSNSAGYQDSFGDSFGPYDVYDLGANKSLTYRTYTTRAKQGKCYVHELEKVSYNPQTGVIEAPKYVLPGRQINRRAIDLLIGHFGRPNSDLIHDPENKRVGMDVNGFTYYVRTLGTDDYHVEDVAGNTYLAYQHNVQRLEVARPSEKMGYEKAVPIQEGWLFQTISEMIYAKEEKEVKYWTGDSISLIIQNRRASGTVRGTIYFDICVPGEDGPLYHTEEVGYWSIDLTTGDRLFQVVMNTWQFGRPQLLENKPAKHRYRGLDQENLFMDDWFFGDLDGEPLVPVVPITIQAQADAIMASAKAKYGAGDLQMNMNGVPADAGATAGGRPVSPTSDAVNQQSGVKKVEGEPNLKEVNMVNEIIDCLFGTKIVARMSNTLAFNDAHVLGYSVGFVPLMRNDANEIIPCNLNLPVRGQFDTETYFEELGLPNVVNEKHKLNHTGLGNLMGDDEPVMVFLARAYRTGAPTCANFFFGTKGWYRNSNIRNAQIQLVFNELNKIEDKLAMTAHVDVTPTVLSTDRRRKLKELLLNGTEPKQLGSNVIKSDGLLNCMPEANKRYWFMVVAEVNGVHGFGKATDADAEFDPRFKQRQLNVDVVNGQVVGDVKNHKKVIQSRFYCNHMTFLSVDDPGAMFDPSAITHFNSHCYEAIVDTLYGDGFLRQTKTTKAMFPQSDFVDTKVKGDPRLDLCEYGRSWLVEGLDKGFKNGPTSILTEVNLGKPPVAQVEVTKKEEVAPTKPEVPVGINISSYETGLGHQLSNLAALPIKFFGVDYKRSEDAYQATKVSLESLADDNVLGLMVEILEAKLVQHRPLLQAISDHGGAKFLAGCTHNLIKNGQLVKAPDRWTGKDGLFMQALRKAYDNLVNGGPEYQRSVYNASVKPDMTSLADALTPPPAVDTSMADELKAYYAALTTVDSKQLNAVNWQDFSMEKFAGWVSSNTVTKEGTMNLNYGLRPAAYACHAYLAACIGVDPIGNLPMMSGYNWQVGHFEALVNIIRSYLIDPDDATDTTNADKIIKFVDNAINIEDGSLVYIIDDIGVVDNDRTRMFKGVIDVLWENKKTKKGMVKVVHDVVATSSYGAFMRFFYYGYIALLSGKLMSCMDSRTISSNLKAFHTKYDKYFPVTSDGTVNMTGPTIHAEACGFNIVGTMLTTETKKVEGKEVEVQTIHKPELMTVVNGKVKVKDFAGAGSEKLTTNYGGYRLRGEVKDSGILETVIFRIAECYSMGFSFNKGTGLRGDLVHVDCGLLAKHAKKWYARLKKRVAKLGYSGDLAGFFVNLNTKVEKGSKRILLRAATSVPSGCVIDVEGRPLLAAALENGRGIKYDNQAARTVPPGFYGIRGGYRSYTQERDLIGTAQRVILGMTIIGPAGEAWHVSGKKHRPTGFVTKKMSYKSSMYKRGAGLHIDTGTILMGCGYDVTQESKYGVNYTYYRPKALQEVGCGDVLAHVDTSVMLEGNRPYLRAIKQTRDIKGYLEWVRTYEVCSMVGGKEGTQLVVEWAITWKEDWPKIRSSVAKGMLASVKKEFIFNADNPGVTERLVDVVYTQDVIKADTLHWLIPIMGHTFVLNPDCVHPEFLWMVNRAMDINFEVQGRRHLDYLVECPVAIADGLYDELQQRFCAFFGRQITVDWQQLGAGDYGTELLKEYAAATKIGKMYNVTNCTRLRQDEEGAELNRDIIVYSDVNFNDPTVYGTEAEERANIFWFYMNPNHTKVLRYKQRSWAMVGREDCDCPIYDVVLFESSTVKEAAGESTQLGSSMRSNYRLLGCDTIREIMMGQAVRALEEPYRAKLLCAGYDGSMGTAGNKVINLCSWKTEKVRGDFVSKAVPNQQGLAEVHALLAGIDLNDPEDNLLFERICFALRNVILRVETTSARALKDNHLVKPKTDDEDVYFDADFDAEYGEDTTTKVGHIDIYAPLLFNLNSLKSGEESLDTMSGMLFYQYLIVLLAGQMPNGVDVNRIRGKLRALVESGNTAKNINGDTLVGGKALSLPNIPTWMLLISDTGRQFDLMSRHVRGYEHPAFDHETGEYTEDVIKHRLNDCPTFAQAVSKGHKAYKTPIFNHETRAPMPDGPLVLTTLLPNTVKELENFYYAPSDLEYIEYRDGQPLVDRKTKEPIVRVDSIYPDVRITSAIAHNMMTAGDDDGDGTYGAILPWKDAATKARLFAALTTAESALEFRANAVGRNEGESAFDVMLRKGCYWGDYMMPKNGRSRYKIAEQLGSYICVGGAVQHSVKDIELYKEENGVIVTTKDEKGKEQPVVLRTVTSYSAINARAREVFATMVGVSYGIYQMAEAIVDIVTALTKAGIEVPARFQWAVSDRAFLIVSAVAELYETILGAYSTAAWHMWKSFMEKIAKPKTIEKRKVANYITESTLPAFAEAVEDIGCNHTLAAAMANCFNVVADVKCWEKGNLYGEHAWAGAGLSEFIMYTALAQFEMGRGKWVGYFKGYLNGENEWDECKVGAHQFISRQLYHWFALGNSINGLEIPEGAFDHSHVLWVMRKIFQPEVLGDVLTHMPGAGYIFADKDGVRPAMDYFRYKLELRAGKQEDNNMELDPIVDITATVVESKPELTPVQEITWLNQELTNVNNGPKTEVPDEVQDDLGVDFYDREMPDCPDDYDDGWCGEYEDDGKEVSWNEINNAIATAEQPAEVAPEPADEDQDDRIYDELDAAYFDDEVSTEELNAAINGTTPAAVVTTEPIADPEPVVVVQQPVSPVVSPLAHVATSDELLANFKAEAEAIAKRKAEEQAYVKRLAEAEAVVANLRAQFGEEAVAELLSKFGYTNPTNGSCSDDKNEPEEPTGGSPTPKPEPKPSGDGGEAASPEPVQQITTTADSISHESAEPSGASSVLEPIINPTPNGVIATEEEEIAEDGTVTMVQTIDVEATPVVDNKKKEVTIVPTLEEATAMTVMSVKAPALPVKVEFTPGNYTTCQQKFMDLVAEGHHVFLTGKAGTGKTYITSECIHRWAAAGDKVVAFGTTGISVMNLAGNLEDGAVEASGTVNSGFALGIAFDSDDRGNENDWQWANKLIALAKVNDYVKENLTCKTGRLRVVIDEVSMLDARILYIVMEIIKYYNPLAQVLLVGDGGQLPVIGEDAVKFYKQAVIDGYLGTLPYMFGEFKVIELQTGVRQKDDRAFEEALDHLRETGEVTGVILERFKQCLEGLRPSNLDDVTYIYFNNKRVEDINERRTAEMTTAKRTYGGQVVYKAATNDKWLREFRPIPVDLTLAIGMPVKLRKNIYQIINSKKTLIAANGSRGRVTKLATNHVEVDFGDGKPLAIGAHEFVGRRLPNGTLSGIFIQLPLHADFATTINSCQGLTLTNPGVCGVFEDIKGETVALTREAALYVMLSRFTKIEDVYFDVSDPRAVNWFIGSQGHVDKEYFEWLKANRH